MKIPTLAGTIDRRILVNYRVDLHVLAGILPAPFRPKQVAGYGIAGICLIRLKQLRPRRLPAWLGFASENAAHRIAVEWNEAGERREGVFIPRRDTSSRWNSFAGGRVFPGVHHRARFNVVEGEGCYRVQVDASDGGHVLVDARLATELPAGSIFASLRQATEFFAAGSVGYSAGAAAGVYEGLELAIDAWRVDPLDVLRVESSFFEDPGRFPAGSAELDCALLMHDVEHQWHAREALAAACC
jgi:hypothetical protein